MLEPQQLELPFQRYDIISDAMVPMTRDYLHDLEQVRWAYGRVREACIDGSVSTNVLEAIHGELRRRLEE